MIDNYNDDYREVIPEEEKTETTLSENRDNEKNSDVRYAWECVVLQWQCLW